MKNGIYSLMITLTLFIACKMSNDVSIDQSTITKENIILKVANGFDVSKLEDVSVMMKGDYYENGEYYLVQNISKMSNADLMVKLENTEGVLYAEIDEVILLPEYSSNSEFIKTFGLTEGDLSKDPDGQNYEYALQITKARDWYDEQKNKHNGAYSEVGYGDKQVVVAIIDTGLNMKHNDFLGVGGNVCLYAKSAFKNTFKNGDYEIIYNPTTHDVNVIIGAFLFQGILTMTPSVINSAINIDVSEVLRIIISNGMIVYALTRSNVQTA